MGFFESIRNFGSGVLGGLRRAVGVGSQASDFIGRGIEMARGLGRTISNIPVVGAIAENLWNSTPIPSQIFNAVENSNRIAGNVIRAGEQALGATSLAGAINPLVNVARDTIMPAVRGGVSGILAPSSNSTIAPANGSFRSAVMPTGFFNAQTI